MAYAAYGQGLDYSFIAGEDFTNYQWTAVKISASAEKVLRASAVTGVRAGPIGIIQDNPPAGQNAAVRMFGESLAVVDASGSAIAFGDFLSPNATSPWKLEKHPSTKTGSPFAISLGELSSGSARINVFILGARY